jgi:Flp pilus assembly protein TadG
MRSLVKYLLRFARCSSGNALVEMTIVVPVAISLMVGGVDFGLALTTQATASKSVRDAARYLGSLRASECTAQIASAQNLAVYGNLAGTGNPLVPNWNASGGTNNHVNITCGSTIVVSANIPYTSIIGATFLPIESTYTLRTQHEEPQVGGL